MKQLLNWPIATILTREEHFTDPPCAELLIDAAAVVAPSNRHDPSAAAALVKREANQLEAHRGVAGHGFSPREGALRVFIVNLSQS